MFHLTILNPKHVLFDGQADSVFLPGDKGEFEILSHHVSIVSLLKPGDVTIDWKTRIPIKNGMVKFVGDECTILVED